MAVDRTDTFYAASDDAIQGYGGQLLVGDGASPEAFEAVAGVVNIEPGDSSSADVDTTHLRSPNRHREHRAGIGDDAVWSIEMIYMPNEWSHSVAGGGSGAFATGGLPAMKTAGTNHNFILKLNNGSPETEIAFRGYVGSFGIGSVDVDGVVHATATVMPTQAITFA